MAAAVGFFLLFLSRGQAWIPAAMSAGSAALSVFLTWALAREIDPDKDLAAFVGVAVAVLGITVFGAGDGMAMAGVLLLLRVINRTTGAAPTLLDYLVVFGLGAWVLIRTIPHWMWRPFVWPGVVIELLFVPVILRSRTLSSVGDLDQEPLAPKRVIGAQVLAVFVGLVFAAALGMQGLVSCLPLLAAMAGSSLWWVSETAVRLVRR